MESDEDTCRLIHDLYLIVPLRLDNFCLLILSVLNAQVFAFDPDFVPVMNATHVHAFEVADCLNETHPKGAICVLASSQIRTDLRVIHELNLHSLVPIRTPRSPVALPLELVGWSP